MAGRSFQWKRQIGYRYAFTIIELMVTIAIIAILAAILLPLFTSAKQAGYRAQCASNLRQLGKAFSMYGDDWNGRWPCPGGLVGDKSYWSQSGSGGLYRYIKDCGLGSVWCCPLLKEWHGKYNPRSYSMNSYLREPADIPYPQCLSERFQVGILVQNVKQPTRTILLFEGMPLTNGREDELDYLYRCADWTRTRGYANIDGSGHTIGSEYPWHGTCNNYLYADYHVTSRPPGKKTTGLLSSYNEMYEWFVDKKYYAEKFAAYR